MASTVGSDTLTLHLDRPGVSAAPDDKLATVAVAGEASGAAAAFTTADTTARLTASLAAGDESAAEACYRRYFDLLFRAARRATGRDESFCLDVVQESVLRVIRAAQRTDSEAAWTTWLRLVVRTTAYDLLRAESRRQRRETVVAAKGSAASDDSADRAIDASEDRDVRLAWLRRQIERLDPQIARAIDLRYSRQWKLARIAEVMGITIGALDGKLRRALDRLRRQAHRDWKVDHDE